MDDHFSTSHRSDGSGSRGGSGPFWPNVQREPWRRSPKGRTTEFRLRTQRRDSGDQRECV